MATVSGSVTTHDGNPYVGEVRFDNLSAPSVVGADVVVGIHDGFRVLTDSSGRFSTTLRAGYYLVSIAAAKAFRTSVPDDGGTYDLGRIGVPGLPHYPGIGTQTAMPVFWGKNDLPNLVLASDVEGLGSSRSQTSAKNSYDFPITSAPEYSYLAIPATWQGPVAPNGILINGFPAVMAGPGEAYGTEEASGYWREKVVVQSLVYALYRLANPTTGSFSMNVIL